MADLNAPLSRAEFDSLREVSKPGGQKTIPPKHRAKLTKLGLIEQKLGGLALMPDGQLRVTQGH